MSTDISAADLPDPLIGRGDSSPTFAPDDGDTWGGPSVLLAAGWEGEILQIPDRKDALTRASRVPLPTSREDSARFQKLEMLGRGGMGEVWRVRDADLNRVVAMKIVRLDRAVNDQLFARFVAEAQATAQLEHPGIVPVYEIGRLPDGRIYYTMQEIRGRTLGVVLTELHEHSTPGSFGVASGGLGFLRVIDAFRQVAETIAFAHASGVIHRDLKPANIMLGAFGEVRVVDWGLVKVLDRTGQSGGGRQDPHRLSPLTLSTGDSSQTSAGAVAGTLGFMAPEQAAGDNEHLSPASDVYALGAILYAILAGEPPVDRALGLPKLDALPRVPTALREVCATALSESPADRYPNAGALAEAVARWLEGAAQQEQRKSQLDRVEDAFCAIPVPLQAEARELLLTLLNAEGRPTPRPASELACRGLDALLAAGLVERCGENIEIPNAELMSHWERAKGWIEADRVSLHVRQALRDQARIWEVRGKPRDHLWRGEHLDELSGWLRQRKPRLTTIEQAFTDASLEHGTRQSHRRRGGAIALIAVLGLGLCGSIYLERQTAAALDTAEQARAAEADALRIAEARALGAHSALAASKQRMGEAVAYAMAAEDAGHEPIAAAHLAAFSERTDPSAVFAGHEGFVYHVEWLDRTRFVTSSIDQSIRLWDASTGALIRTVQTDVAAVTLGPSPDGHTVAVALEDGSFELWDMDTGDRIVHQQAHDGAATWAEFSADGRLALSSGYDDTVKIWDASTGALKHTLDLGKVTLTDAAFAAVGSRLAAWPARPGVWDAETGESVFLAPPEVADSNAAISPDGTRLATATQHGELSLWDVDTGRSLWSVTPDKASLAPRLAFALDGARLVYGRGDGRVGVIDASTGEVIALSVGHGAMVQSVTVGPDGRQFLTVGSDGSVGLWDAQNGRKLAEYMDVSQRVAIARLSRDGRAIALASQDGLARVWRPPVLNAATALSRCDGRDGAFAASSQNGAWLGIWTPVGLCVRPVEEDAPVLTGLDATALVISRDGAHMAVALPDHTVAMVQTDGGQILWRGPVIEGIRAGAFTRDERALVVQDGDGALRYIDALTGLTGRVIPVIERSFGHSGMMETLATPTFALPNAQGGLSVYDSDTGEKVRELPAGLISLYAPFAARGLNNGLMAAGDERGWLRAWDATGKEPVWALRLGNASVVSMAERPDGSEIAVGDAAGMIYRIDLKTHALISSFDAQDGAVELVAWDPEGARLVLTSRTGAISSWEAETGSSLWWWRSPYHSNAGACALSEGRVLTYDPAGLRLWTAASDSPGLRTNYRVCPGTTDVVPVSPFPAADSVWAPAELCEKSARI